MNHDITNHPGDFISLRGAALKTTSLKVAEAFGKLHKNVLQKLEDLDCSPRFRELNFKLSSAELSMPNGGTKTTPIWEMTKDGFMFLVMGFTGKKMRRRRAGTMTLTGRAPSV